MTEVNRKGNTHIQDTNGWEVLIPTKLLSNGLQKINVLAVSKENTEYAISDSITTLNIIKSWPFPDIMELSHLNDSTDYIVDNINGISASEFNSLHDCNHYLNLSGWAIDKMRHDISGGIIVSLDGKEYQSQFRLEREDIVNVFNSERFKYAGWGITIPSDNLEEGRHELSFKVLNNKQQGYYTSSKKISFQYIKDVPVNILKDMILSDKKTQYSLDEINGVIINKSKRLLQFSASQMMITGWAVDIFARKPASMVLIEIDGRLFKSLYGKIRPDVSKYLKNTIYQYSGWTISIPSAIIGKGYHRLRLKIVSNDKMSYFTTEKEIIFKVI